MKTKETKPFAGCKYLAFWKADRAAQNMHRISREAALRALGQVLFDRLCFGAIISQNRCYAVEAGGFTFDARDGGDFKKKTRKP